MDAREIVDAYLQGRIESWGVYRRLVKLGLSTATALAVAGLLPSAVNAKSATLLGEANHSEQESPLLDLLMSQLASQLETVAGDGSVRPLAATLARIGGNNANLANCENRAECLPVKLNYNDGFNTNLIGELRPDLNKNNVQLHLDGNIGQTNVNLLGSFDPPAPIRSAEGRNLNIGKVNMNISGNVGPTNVNLNGNLSNLSNPSQIVK
jgi:hypothetical protein